MITLLQNEWRTDQDFDLLDAGGGAVARLVGNGDGGVEAHPDSFGLSGRWQFDGAVLQIVDSQGALRARFNSEGLDERGRHLIWGHIKVGEHWLEHALRATLRPAPRISFCISSRGRLHHLRQTLPQNIADNRDYPNLEFVLLDYNSSDGMEDWVRDELKAEIDSGRLAYYRAPHPTHFHPTHSRNMSIRLATGDIVCVVDADNFTGRGFASYLADNVRPDNFLVGCRLEGDEFAPIHDQGAAGRYALYKTTFLDVGGMDEEHVGWGYDDVDLYSRLRAKGYRCQSMERRYAKCIAHDDSERRKELVYQDIGRDKTSGDGSVWVNARRSQANIAAGRLVLNDGRIGCGLAIRNFGEATVEVRERPQPLVSLCIAVGERDAEARRSLVAVLQATRLYPHLEVVVLDNPDGPLEAWAQYECAEDLALGRLVYSRMVTPYGHPRCTNPVRQQNIAARLAKGDVLCVLPPGVTITDGVVSNLAARHHDGWIVGACGEGGVALSRHLFYLAEGFDQALPIDAAPGDLLRRVEGLLAEGVGSSRWSRSGLEGRDFGAGMVLRNGEPVVVSPHRFPRVSLVIMTGGSREDNRRAASRALVDNRDYPNLEVVLFESGTRDASDLWRDEDLRPALEARRIVHYTPAPGQQLSAAEARASALRLASGEILCLVTGNGPAGHHLAFHLAHRLQDNEFLSDRAAIADTAASDPGGTAGFASRRETFHGLLSMLAPGDVLPDPYRAAAQAGYAYATIDARFLFSSRGDETVDVGIASRRTDLAVHGSVDASVLDLPPIRYRRISLCITCKDRLHHLKQTLPRNLADNRSYPNLEVVLLDYNSSDGLEAWARESLSEALDCGRLVYFRTTDPGYFHRSHARNLAFRLASGEIVCTLDADNFSGRDFAHYVNERFDRQSSIFLRPDFEGSHVRLTDAFGRVCVQKEDFLRVEGYDEALADYGFEDLDFSKRLERANLKPRFIESERFLGYIHHGNRERIANGPVLAQASLLLRGLGHGNEWESIVYLLRDGKFIWQGPQVEGVPTEGHWLESGNELELVCGRGTGAATLARQHAGEATYRFLRPTVDLKLRASDDLEFFSGAFKNIAMEKNRVRYHQNLERAKIQVNDGQFGFATVSRNFSGQAVPIDLLDRRPEE